MKLAPTFYHLLHKTNHKIRQTKRISRKSVAFIFLLIGAAFVSLVSLGFARAADWALELQSHWAQNYPYLAWVILPLALMLIAFLTRKFAPYTAGSGIPQVLASLSLPFGAEKSRPIVLGQTILKIPLTFLGMLAGASIGREGPSVQVGAAVMSAWGKWCKRRNLAFKGLQENDLIAAGAAGGLAAAFNAPLAGVVFAIEELGRSALLRWERQIFIGVLASGFILVAIDGNNPYFSHFYGRQLKHMLLWVLICALICGIAGGLFARFLSKGVAWLVPNSKKSWIRRHPIIVAGFLGLILALLGTISQGETYGTGYNIASYALQGDTDVAMPLAIFKWAATIISYWAGIPGGIFTPSLTIGALLGVHLAQLSQFYLESHVLVLLCMAAFLAAATQAPLTSSVVVMEMTGSQSLLFWVLIGAMLASAVSRQFCPKPFYHAVAARFRQTVREEYKRKNNDKLPAPTAEAPEVAETPEPKPQVSDTKTL